VTRRHAGHEPGRARCPTRLVGESARRRRPGRSLPVVYVRVVWPSRRHVDPADVYVSVVQRAPYGVGRCPVNRKPVDTARSSGTRHAGPARAGSRAQSAAMPGPRTCASTGRGSHQEPTNWSTRTGRSSEPRNHCSNRGARHDDPTSAAAARHPRPLRACCQPVPVCSVSSRECRVHQDQPRPCPRSTNGVTT